MPRARKPQLLSELLKQYGESLTNKTHDARRRKRKDILVAAIWELITEGTVRLPNHSRLEVGPKDWLDAVKWLLQYLEPPQSRVQLSAGDGVTLAANVANMTDEELKKVIERANKFKKAVEDECPELIQPEPNLN